MFVPRTFEQILNEMIAHVRATTTLTDFTVGSNIRTILEASALEDDEQYHQMVQLLDAFRVATATGADLDQRAADLNMERLSSKESYGSAVFRDEGLTTTEASFAVSSGATTLKVLDSSDFPVTYPYTIRIGEGTPQVEDIAVSNNDTIFNTFTLSTPLVNNHSVGDRVSHVTGSDKTIPANQQIQTKATTTSSPIKFMTVESAYILAGDYESHAVDIIAAEAGSDGNVAAGQIIQFTSSPPFTGAAVINTVATTGGRDVETDAELRSRLLRRFDELARGVPAAIEQTVVGVEDSKTGKRIVTAKLREDFVDGDHVLYVDDGTGFVPDSTSMGATTFFSLVGSGVSAIPAVDVSAFPSSGYLLLSAGLPSIAELVHYSSKTSSTNTFNLDSATLFGHNSGDEVILVEQVGVAEDGQNYFRLSNYPLKVNSFEVYHNQSGQYVEKTDGTDFFINLTNGEIQFVGAGLTAGTIVLAAYTYYTGLLQKVQKVLNGDPNDRTNYPGVVAGGVIIRADTPTLREVRVTASISVSVGFDETDVAPQVETAIAGYVDNLGIGENVIRAAIIEKVMGISGVSNVTLTEPLADIVVLEDELPVSYDSNGNSLVTVL